MKYKKVGLSVIIVTGMLLLAAGSSESSSKLSIEDLAYNSTQKVFDGLIENYSKDESKTIAQKKKVSAYLREVIWAIDHCNLEVMSELRSKSSNMTEKQAKEFYFKALMYAYADLDGKTPEELVELVEQNGNSLKVKWNKRYLEYIQNN